MLIFCSQSHRKPFAGQDLNAFTRKIRPAIFQNMGYITTTSGK
jgi:hypothetical protein